MNRWTTTFLAGAAAWTLSAGPLMATELLRSTTDQEANSARHAGEAHRPRLPAAQDLHRTGPSQDPAGSGAVPDTPPTAPDGSAARSNRKASSAERAERNSNARPEDASEQAEEQTRQ